MSCLFVYSLRSDYCKTIHSFINDNDILKTLVKMHDVNVMGVPPKIERVPSLITPDGNVIIGSDIRTYLDDLLYQDIEPVDTFKNTYGIDGTHTTDLCDIENFGKSIQPKMTKELEEKINTKVEDAYHKLKTN